MSRIVKLQAQNVKRLSAVEITPDGNAVIIGGKNAQGKSSILDAIEYALAGKSSHCDRVVRDGEKGARVVVETDDLVVTRRWTAKGGTTLEVAGKDGRPYKSPQQVLDALCGSLTFDPIEFSRMRPDAQAKVLRDLVGLDTSDLDQRREKAYAERRDINRDAKQVEAQLNGIEEPPRDTPDEAPKVNDLVAKLNDAQENADLLDEQIGAKAALEHRIQDLRRSLQEAKDELIAVNLDIERLQMTDWGSAIRRLRQDLDLVTDIQENVARKKARQEHAQRMAELTTASDKLTEELAALDQEKEKRTAAAKYPIPGLSVTDDGVTLNGVPLEQASSAEQIRVSMAIAMASSPGLRVALIREGAFLDKDSLAEVCKIAEEHDAQLWIERVGDGDECSIIIEDGAVK